jgi:hypothetical protein
MTDKLSISRALRHATEDNPYAALHRDEAILLDRTIRALTNLSKVEGGIRQMAFCDQTSICYRYS